MTGHLISPSQLVEMCVLSENDVYDKVFTSAPLIRHGSTQHFVSHKPQRMPLHGGTAGMVVILCIYRRSLAFNTWNCYLQTLSKAKVCSFAKAFFLARTFYSSHRVSLLQEAFTSK